MTLKLILNKHYLPGKANKKITLGQGEYRTKIDQGETAKALYWDRK
jgi:hypothetical protein